jgi:hypothetical protein
MELSMAEQARTDERSQLTSFLAYLKGSKGAQELLPSLRVLSKGIFIDERAASGLVEHYQSWLEKESHGEVHKSPDKSFQWLFEGRDPVKHYLVEGKNVLVGFVAPVLIPNPQQFGLPYYLGSLLSGENYLHPADPSICKLSKVEARQGKLGFEFHITARRSTLVVQEKVVRDFAALIRDSRFVERRYPEALRTLAGALKLLVALVRRARVIPRTFPIVVPYDVKNSKSKNIRMAGKFMLIEEKGNLLRTIELSGRNLSGFLRAELVRAPREKLGTFKLTPKHRDLMGFYEAFGKRRSVHARAFAEFEEGVRRTRDARERFQGFFTAPECFEKFSQWYQLSQPIEFHKIKSSVERFGVKGERYQLYGGWIFAFDRSQTLVRCVGRHIRMPGHRRGAA